MSLTAEEITDLGLWSHIQFGDLAMMEAAKRRYLRFLAHQRQIASS